MMIKENTHIIQQQIFEINVDNKELAQEVQNTISSVYNNRITALLESVFSSFNTTKERIRIDSLTLDLGALDKTRLEQDLAEKIKAQLEEKLGPLVYKVRHDQAQKGVKFVSQKAGIDLLYFYLEKGRFPWWSKAEDQQLKSLTQQFMAMDLKQRHQKAKILSLLQNPVSQKRIIALLSPSDLEQVLSKLDEPLSTLTFKIQKDLILLLDKIIDRNQIKKHLAFSSMSLLLENFIRKNKSLDSKDLVSSFIENQFLELFRSNSSFFQIQKKHLDKIASIPESDFEIIKKEKLIKTLKSLLESASEKKKVTDLHFSKNPQPPLATDKGSSASVDPSSSFSNTKAILDESESIVLNQSGIVLLWPFLQIFFRELGLLDQNNFKDENAQWKAIYLLHFLATGKEESEEQELLIYKLLCNVPLEDFVPSYIELSELEKEECEHLLTTVVKNWSVLKNTSNDGLRQAFLQRDGILSQAGKNCLIQVERNSQDLLLDKLNWSYSNIKLPWNDYLIQVEW